MTQPYILICDDEADRERRWQDRLLALEEVREAFEVRTVRPVDVPDTPSPDHPVAPEPLTRIIAALDSRRRLARLGEAVTFDDAASVLDGAAILVVDYDLLMLGESGSDFSHLTGERVAYLARCYSKCGLIVAMNQFANDGASFDLNLTGQPRSYADLNIASSEIDNPGLWSEDRDRWQRYRPWRWPVLPLAVEAFEARVGELLKGHLDTPVVSYLGIPQSVYDAMPRTMIDFLAAGLGEEAGGIDEITFRQVAERSEVGLKHKDRALSDDFLTRIAAARVLHWVERVVVPAQDVLVDAPHLVLRLPSVLAVEVEEREDPSMWDGTARFAPREELPLNDEPFAGARFERSSWGSRPLWFWDSVSQTPSIPEIERPWEAERPPFVFAEDTSRFVSPGDARSFVADVTSPYSKRYVEALADVSYRPAVRFSI